jgi:glycerol dehydrogenase-like iron-containing ADH family enzyme
VQADETIHNMPFPVTADSVAAAIVAADALGRSATGS